MSVFRILGIDLRRKRDGPGLAAMLPCKYTVAVVDQVDPALRKARNFHPDLACVEFDYPDESRLRVVPAMTGEFPSLPFLMFTEYHSEAMAVWAFRSGVKDYRVKPLGEKLLEELVAHHVRSAHQVRRLVDPEPPVMPMPEKHLLGAPMTTVRTAAAVAYIAAHYEETVSQGKVASLCHLSTSEFSRIFRREHGVTFERFVLEFRIAKARDLLIESRLPITQVAHAVGFNESSYFARAFRQIAGVTASEWRRHTHAPSPPHAA